MTDTLPPPGDPMGRTTAGSAAGSGDKTMALAVYVLHLLGFVTGFLTNIIAVVLAYVARDKAPEWLRSHYDFAIRTFWIGLIGALAMVVLTVISLVLLVVLIGFLLMPVVLLAWAALGVWLLVRCVLGLSHLVQGRPYPRPETLLV